MADGVFCVVILAAFLQLAKQLVDAIVVNIVGVVDVFELDPKKYQTIKLINDNISVY